MIRLIVPNKQYLQSYKEACKEYADHHVSTYHFTDASDCDVLAKFDNYRNERNLKPDRVGADYYWLVEDETAFFIGEVTIRHKLNEALLQSGGHIGYGVRCSEWSRGYGTMLLALALEKAKERRISPVLITCNNDNAASARVIEKNGFILKDTITVSENGKDVQKRRYWKTILPTDPGSPRAGCAKGCQMKLTEPSTEYAAGIAGYRMAFLASGDSMDGTDALRQFEDPQDWIDHVNAGKNAATIAPGKVPATLYLYVRESDQKIVGMIQIRHYFNEYLEKYAGHIGYSIAPDERCKGYATQMLRDTLPKCRDLGISKALICCYRENEGSRKTILKNGGIYESTVFEPEKKKWIERYWIDLSGDRGT